MQNLRAEPASVDPNLGVLIPSFMLSEIARAFEIDLDIFAIFNHRLGRRCGSYVDGYDDGTPCSSVAAIQTGILRCVGWCCWPRLWSGATQAPNLQ